MTTINLTAEQVRVLRFVAEHGRISMDTWTPARERKAIESLRRRGMLNTGPWGGDFVIEQHGRDWLAANPNTEET
ncbi:MAG TPA: hypothetical protein VK453_25755 [Micromonosporaceae bacterium]|nr:hypothetical protein [Micromonosporaceae bacterium]